MNKKMWAVLVHLSRDMCLGEHNNKPMEFDDDKWSYILRESVKSDVNTIVLNLGNGIHYASHPEIAKEGAWTRSRIRREVARCRDMGISLIPKLNFSTSHHMWLGIYSRMVSTPQYYKVCNDLIHEVYELFDRPQYIHIGMDEEDAGHQKEYKYCVFRQGELYFHDLRYLLDCVHDTGAKPWIWACPMFDFTKEFKKHIVPDELIISPWYYLAIREENFTLISSSQEYIDYYSKPEYEGLNLKYVEDDPFLKDVRTRAIPLMSEGYTYVPCASVFNRCNHNTRDLVEHFHNNAPDSQILGYMSAPWCGVNSNDSRFEVFYEETFRFLKEAKEEFYGD